MRPNWDCRHLGGECKADEDTPGCFVQDPIPFQGEPLQRFPHVMEAPRGGRASVRTRARGLHPGCVGPNRTYDAVTGLTAQQRVVGPTGSLTCMKQLLIFIAIVVVVMAGVALLEFTGVSLDVTSADPSRTTSVTATS